MKKLLAIVVLGLLFSGNAQAYDNKVCIKGNCENGAGTLSTTADAGHKIFYIGNFVNGLLTGEGKIETDTMIKEGNYKKGLLHGKGKFKLKDEFMTYEGDYKNGDWHGYGKLFINFDKGAETYEGQFRKGKQHGEGILTVSDGSVYFVKYKKGLIVESYQSPENKVKVEDKKSSNENKIKMSEMIDDSKKTCKLLGMKEGTEKFSDCALKLYTQKVELAGQKNQQVIVQGQSTGSNVTTIYDPVRDNNAMIKRGMGLINGTCSLGDLSNC